MLLAGAELFFIPLSDVFMRGAFGIVMHMGLAGYAGVMIGSVLVICGLLSWVQPMHKSFYGIIGAIAAVASFPASNFGGFFLGMLLGVIGGSLTFGWTERAEPADADGQSSGGGGRRRPSSGLRGPTRTTSGTTTQGAAHSLVLPILLSGLLGSSQAVGLMLDGGCLLPTGCTTVDGVDADVDAGDVDLDLDLDAGPVDAGDVDAGDVEATAPNTNRAWGELAVEWLVQQGHPRRLAERTVATALDAEQPLTRERSELWKAVLRALGDPPELIEPLPQPPDLKPPDTTLPGAKLPELGLPDVKLPDPELPDLELPEGPEGLPLPDLSEPPFVGPVLPPEPIPGLETTADAQEASPQVEPTPGLSACASRVVLTAGTANISGFAYRGVADVPLAQGGTVRMMMFTADSFGATGGVRAEITGVGNSTVLTSSALSFEDDIVLYATELSGELMGVPVTLTPDNAQSLLLRVLNTVTPRMPIEMTDVSALQPVLTARLMTGTLELAAE